MFYLLINKNENKCNKNPYNLCYEDIICKEHFKNKGQKTMTDAKGRNINP